MRWLSKAGSAALGLTLALCQAQATVAFAADPQPVDIGVLDVDDGRAEAFTAVIPEWRHRLIVQFKQFSAPESIRISVSPMRSADAETPASLSANGSAGASLSLSVIDGTAEVTIAAKLPAQGAYTGYLRIERAGHAPWIKALRVNRVLAPVPVELSGARRASGGDCPTCFRSAAVTVNIQALADRDVLLTASLIEFGLVRSGAEKRQASMDPVRFTLDGLQIGATPATVRKGAAGNLTLVLSGLAEPGEYTGKVRIGSQGYKPQDFDFNVSVRDGWVVAASLILLGSISSIALRRYGTDERPRLVVRQRVAALAERSEQLRSGPPKLDAVESRVLDALAAPLARMQNESLRRGVLPSEWVVSADVTLARIERKLESFVQWANARRELLSLDPSRASSAQVDLDQVQSALMGDGDPPAQTLSALADLPAKIQRSWADTFNSALDQFEALVKHHLKIAAETYKDSPNLTELRQQLATARAVAQSGNRAVAQAALSRASFLYVTVLADCLRYVLAGPRPAGFDDSTWQALHTDIEQELLTSSSANSAAEADASFKRAARIFKARLVMALQREVVHAGARVEDLPEGDRQDFINLLNSASAILDEVESSTRIGEPSLVPDGYLVAAAKLQEALKLAAGGAAPFAEILTGADQLAPLSSIEFPAAMPHTAEVPPIAAPTVVVESADQLERRRRTIDHWVDFFSVGLATVLGIVWVWNTNAVWGGLGDWLLALLWGLGLHQVSGYTFEGVLGLQAKLTK